MIDLETAGQELDAFTGKLECLRSSLLDLQAGLPPSPAETSEDDFDAEPHPSAELRAFIGCGVQDCLNPLIRCLAAAAKRAKR